MRNWQFKEQKPSQSKNSTGHYSFFPHSTWGTLLHSVQTGHPSHPGHGVGYKPEHHWCINNNIWRDKSQSHSMRFPIGDFFSYFKGIIASHKESKMPMNHGLDHCVSVQFWCFLILNYIHNKKSQKLKGSFLYSLLMLNVLKKSCQIQLLSKKATLIREFVHILVWV